jgi:hypothetical protein
MPLSGTLPVVVEGCADRNRLWWGIGTDFAFLEGRAGSRSETINRMEETP